MNTNFLVYTFITLFSMLIILVLLLRAGVFPRSIHYLATKSTDLRNEKISGLPLDVPIETLSGSPNKKTINLLENSSNDYNTYSIEKGLDVKTLKQSSQVSSIVATNPKFSTIKGIKVGDNQINIYWQYGIECYKREESGVLIQGYVDKSHHTTLEFGLLNQRIQFINLSHSNMQ